MESLRLLNTKQAEGRHGSGSWFLWMAHGSDTVALDFPRNAICQWISQTEQQLDPDEPIVLRVQNSSHTEQRSSFPGRFNSWSWVSLCMPTTLCVIMWSHWGNKQHLVQDQQVVGSVSKSRFFPNVHEKNFNPLSCQTTNGKQCFLAIVLFLHFRQS